MNSAPFSGSRELGGSLERGTRVTARREIRFAELTFGDQNGRTHKRKNVKAFINTSIYP